MSTNNRRAKSLTPIKESPAAAAAAAARRLRVMIVDDHEILRHGLSELVNNAPDLEVCAEAADIAGALRALRTSQPDLAVIDISLKHGNGLDLVRQIKTIAPAVRMLVLSMHDETLYAERAMRAGAHGYVNKQEASDTIITALRRVVEGKLYVSDRMSNRLLQRVINGEKLPEGLPVETLSDRELEVFELLGQGLGTRQIAEKLCVSIKTIESHREKIKTKLHVASSAELVRQAVEWALRGSIPGDGHPS